MSDSKHPGDPVIVWFRRDLRLHDHAALTAAAASGRPLLPVFVYEESGSWAWGGASRVWLHHSLLSLKRRLAELGLPLIVRRGEPVPVLLELAHGARVQAVHWHRRYEPLDAAQDAAAAAALRTAGVEVHEHPGALLAEPGEIRTLQGGVYKVFTPFHRRFKELIRPDLPLPVPGRVTSPTAVPNLLAVESLGLAPNLDWTEGIREVWRPGPLEPDAALRSYDHLRTQGPDRGMDHYETERDVPALHGTSLMSPHLHWGEVSVRALWHEIAELSPPASEPYRRQLLWREFAHHLLHEAPHTVDAPLRDEFRNFPCDGDPALLGAWQRGETGYPLVDAGMRQLWRTGWMHNRVRMVAASFLVKHLLLPWQDGARWFWDTLVDADLANNTFGWQWTAGCGADAAPYFRIFNPTAQGRRFDPQGHYVRRWLPELARVPARWVHEPWRGDSAALKEWGVRLGTDYPEPVVDHEAARERALASYRRMKGTAVSEG